MKSTIISMIIVLIVMVTLPMIFLGDGDVASKLGFGDFFKKGSGSSKVPENVKAVVTDRKVNIYTWVDENGVKQFSGIPPADGGASEKIVLKPDTNIMSAFKAPEKEEEEKKASRPKVVSLGSPYTPGGMKDLVDNSKDIKGSMGNRQTEQEKMMQELFPQLSGNKK